VKAQPFNPLAPKCHKYIRAVSLVSNQQAEAMTRVLVVLVQSRTISGCHCLL
jgi:hypothetical protein